MKNKTTILPILILLLLGVLIYSALGDAIDQGIQSQDRMLCESAKTSGNQQYLARCEALGMYK